MVSLPVTVIGGYLGSGKTTLVNHLLRAADGLRLAIMVNEFGDLPIDEDLIEAQGDDMIALAGGCVCCSYGDDLMAAMQQMAAMDPPPDHIVLEASGVALPGSIASSLSLLPDVVDDGIVVVADAETVRSRAADKYMYDTVLRQLSDADLIVLNKVDLVDVETLADVRDWLAQKAPQASIINSEHSAVDPSLILQSFIGRPRGAYLTNSHRNPMKSKVVIPEGVVDADAFAESLAQHEGIVRAKGFVLSENGMTLVQVVGQRWAISTADSGREVGVVVIGFDLSGV
ncbi:CobW family GTP-binding protein [Pseudahrensia aquimaris]|uniref:CobW family GTP-binding protein n=1 Tax=Pseudahrensia aquimaris TaxID=744461 RepID=A0ABW3FEE3_9HYPH